MLIRTERAGDFHSIRWVHANAFRRPDSTEDPIEVELIDRLRSSSDWLPELSLVATRGDDVVGHVACSRAAVGDTGVVAVGPIGVVPAYQRRGIGTALMEAAIAAADIAGEPLIGLLGDPTFYRRFGFVSATSIGIEPPDSTWGVAFQIRPLEACRRQIVGTFRYAPAFDLVGG